MTRALFWTNPLARDGGFCRAARECGSNYAASNRSPSFCGVFRGVSVQFADMIFAQFQCSIRAACHILSKSFKQAQRNFAVTSSSHCRFARHHLNVNNVTKRGRMNCPQLVKKVFGYARPFWQASQNGQSCPLCRLRTSNPAHFVRFNAKVGPHRPLSHYSPVLS